MGNFFWSHTKSGNTLTSLHHGLLYNAYAFERTGANSITSDDNWKVSSGIEYYNLVKYIWAINSLGTMPESSDPIAGGQFLKEMGTVYWAIDTAGNNNLGFNARGSGWRYGNDGTFSGTINGRLDAWTSTKYNATDYEIYVIYSNNNTGFSKTNIWLIQPDKKRGLSLRLTRNSTNLSNGQSGIYTGNDGKVYRTICINGVEWLADNLAETKYRSGNLIPEVTGNAAWAALTTGALCAYNNNWNNV